MHWLGLGHWLGQVSDRSPGGRGSERRRPAANKKQTLLLILAACFVGLGTVTLALVSPTPTLTEGHLLALVGGWGLGWGLGYAYLRQRLPDADPFIVPVVAMLTGWGLLLQARLAPAFLLRQVIWLLLSIGVLCLIATIPTLPRLLRRYRYTLLVIGLLQLGTTLIFGVNPSGQGQRLWLGALGVYFQPSEFLKLLLVIYLAAYLSERREIVQTHERQFSLWIFVLGPMLLMFGLALLLLGWQQDLGAAILFYLTFLAMLYLAWGRVLHVALGLFLFTPVAIAGYYLSARVALRLSIWLDPWAPGQADRAFQILQSLFALAAGGLLGQGLGQGNPTFIPVVHSDFVYAALIEEFGMLGAIGCIALLGLLVVRGLQISQRAESPFETLLAGGIAALLGIQSCVIIAGTTKLMPLTGITLPFLSYGGSSLLTTMMAMGLWLNLSAPQRPTLSLTINKNTAPPLRKTTGQLGQALLALLSMMALGTGYWAIIRSEDLRDYPTNPRHLLAEARIRRGRITDRDNTALADISIDEEGFVTRTYPVPEAAPVVGYTTYQYGNAGIESACDAVLRGDVRPDNTRPLRPPLEILRNELLQQPLAPSNITQGYTIRLTLDATLQALAQRLLKGKQGAILLVDAHTGDILTLGSAPIYEPAQVTEMWDTLRNDPHAPLLNRATQDLAQPGAALETVILATALQHGVLTTSSAATRTPIPIDTLIHVNGITLTCATTPQANTWEAALVSACPAPFVTLAQTLGIETLARRYADWGLTTAPALVLPTVASEWDMDDAADAIEAEATGQGNLLVTPLQMVGVAATLANYGERPPLHLLAEPTPGCQGHRPTEGVPLIPADIAQTLRDLWPHWGYDVIGHLGTALAGPERTITWFLGLGPRQAPRYAVVVMLESPDVPEDAAAIGQRLIREVIGP